MAMRYRTNLEASNIFIDLTPLVDVTFLMLIFFMITSDILPLKSLHVENPPLNRDSAPLTTQLLVVMDAHNVLYLGPRKEIVDMVSLKDSLTNEISTMKQRHPGINPTVVRSIDRRVDYGAFLRLFAIAQECSPRIRLVYKPEDDDHAEYF